MTMFRYVNASTFDHVHDIYYGLLNNFNDPSLGQKLITVNVKDGTSTIYNYDSTTYPLLYYISYTPHGIFGMAAEIDFGYAQLGSITLNEGSGGEDDVDGTLSFHIVETYNKPLGKYSPIFYSEDANDNTNGYGQVCSALGTSDGQPYGLACYNLFLGQVAYDVNGMTFGAGNVNAVACYA
jgi:hypothetical protein